jgi:DNA-directed RNA polymerase subunit beta'
MANNKNQKQLTKVEDILSIRIRLASPQDILSWSHGEVLKAETINYRTQRPEKDGLFDERIFGPTKDYECYCGKYKGPRYKGIICDRCGVEVTKSDVRRERMGHIKLAAPVAHIWFLRGVPSRMGLVLNISALQLEKVIYFAAYIITKVDNTLQKKIIDEIQKEAKEKIQETKQKITDKKQLEEELKKIKKLEKIRLDEVNSIKPLRIISEVEYRELSLRYGEMFQAETGGEAVKSLLEKIDLNKEVKNLEEELKLVKSKEKKKEILMRLKVFKGMLKTKVRPEWMFLEVLPVLPPDLRPMVQIDGGRFASSDLNDLYRRIINRNNRLKYLLEVGAPEVIVKNEKRMLQEAVDALIDNKMRRTQVTKASTGGKRALKSLTDILTGKEGRFRKNLLGKRVDYSGRSVIAVEPNLKLYECGLPKVLALELFRPFVIKKILDRELAFNVRGASRLIDEGIDEVWAALEEVVQDKFVLLNRAPTLHRISIQAFKPRLVEGLALKIHPLVCAAFNADFDGDQMAVYLPLSKEAQYEAKEIMLSSKNLLKPANGDPIALPSKDIVLGIYWLTGEKEKAKGEGKIFADEKECLLAHSQGVVDVRAKIKVFKNNQILETTPGRLIFNEVLPEGFEYINEQLTSKKLAKIIEKIIRNYPEEIVQETLDKIKELGFEYSTLSGISWGMDDLIIPKEREEIIKKAEKEIEVYEEQYQNGLLSLQEFTNKKIQIWQEAREAIAKLVPQALPKDNSVYAIVNSGSRGSWAQPIQMAGIKGLVTSPSGKIIDLPILHCYKEGFNILEYFISTHGARKGTVDTALRTSAAGYLTRRLIDVSHEVLITQEDCGDKKGREMDKKDALEIGQSFRYKILGRVSLEDIKTKDGKIIVKKGEVITPEMAKLIEEDETIQKVRVRTPLSCKALRGVCRQCYGWDLGKNRMVEIGDAVGIVAAQSIGEPGTQLTLRTFHTGGVVGVGDITQGLPRVEEVFEASLPKREGLISPCEGKVKEIDLKEGKLIIEGKGKNNDKKAEFILKIPERVEVYVKKGDKVNFGQQLTSGSLDLKKLLKYTNVEETQKYILHEIQRIYSSEGINIHDKHIETIIRQMFSRVRITDPGDSDFLPNQIVSKAQFLEEKEKLEKNNKIPPKAKATILGISKVALTSESFLSAASFQETTRVLISAALEGKEDFLRGLKENVIIGKLIPAGTGIRKPFQKDEEKEK